MSEEALVAESLPTAQDIDSTDREPSSKFGSWHFHGPEVRNGTDGMQSFLHATKQPNSNERSNRSPHAAVHGAHHPLAATGEGTGRVQSHRRLSSIQKLVVFAVLSLIVLAYVLLGPVPHMTMTSQRPADAPPNSGVQRRDSYAGQGAKSQPSEYVKSFFAVAPPHTCPQVFYASSDVAAHRSLTDLWLVINGMVLNVTRFVPTHPGGRVILDGAAEDDAAALFAQYHSPSTLSLLNNFCIGRVR